MKRRYWVIIGIVAVVALGYVGARYVGNRGANSNAQTEYTTVTRGTIQETIIAAGSVDPSLRSTLSFDTPGRLAELLVNEGDTVTKGQILAQLDAADLELALKTAQVSLDGAKARYDQTVAGPSKESIAAAEASLASAEASFETLKAGPSPDDVAAAKAQVDKTAAVLQQAQAAYDRVAWMPGIGMMPQSLQLQQATIDHNLAMANYRIATAGPTDSAVKAAEAQIAQAKSSLAQLKASPTADDIAIADSQVKSAEIAVQQAQNRLDAATLSAPFDGIVETIYADSGQLITAGTPIVTLADHSSYQIMVSADELDITKIEVGQEATISLDALPDVTIPGRVTQVAIAPTDTGSVVSYDVKVQLDPTTAPVRVGMSSTVEIRTAEKQDVLLLPNRFIQFDQQTGAKYVMVLRDGKLVRADITTGLRDDTNSEIVSGLSEGEQVALTTQTLNQQLFGGFGQ